MFSTDSTHVRVQHWYLCSTDEGWWCQVPFSSDSAVLCVAVWLQCNSPCKEVCIASLFKLLSEHSQVNGVVFRFYERHRLWGDSTGVHSCSQVTVQVSRKGRGHASTRQPRFEVLSTPGWALSSGSIRLLLSHDCQIHKKYFAWFPKLLMLPAEWKCKWMLSCS